MLDAAITLLLENIYVSAGLGVLLLIGSVTSSVFRKALIKIILVGGAIVAAYVIYLAATGQEDGVTDRQGISEEQTEQHAQPGKLYYSDPEKRMQQENMKQE